MLNSCLESLKLDLCRFKEINHRHCLGIISMRNASFIKSNQPEFIVSIPSLTNLIENWKFENEVLGNGIKLIELQIFGYLRRDQEWEHFSPLNDAIPRPIKKNASKTIQNRRNRSELMWLYELNTSLKLVYQDRLNDLASISQRFSTYSTSKKSPKYPMQIWKSDG